MGHSVLSRESNRTHNQKQIRCINRNVCWWKGVVGVPKFICEWIWSVCKKIIRNNSLELPNTIVIHDDLDLPAGTLRLKVEGGHGGHNGLRSIINFVGNNFIRLRVGIGHPGNKADVTDWVLGKFKPNEKVLLDDGYIEFLNIIDFLAELQIEKAQLRLHTE